MGLTLLGSSFGTGSIWLSGFQQCPNSGSQFACKDQTSENVPFSSVVTLCVTCVEMQKRIYSEDLSLTAILDSVKLRHAYINMSHLLKYTFPVRKLLMNVESKTYFVLAVVTFSTNDKKEHL